MSMKKRLGIGLGLALLVTAADQASKAAILAVMRPPGVEETPFLGQGLIPVTPFLDFTLSWNSGVSFGLGNNHGDWNVLFFTVLALVIGAGLFRWMATSKGLSLLISQGLVLGGALGNVIDRLRYGAVVDFLYVHVGAFNWWPNFNLADSAICTGAVLMVFDSLFAERLSHKNSL